MLQLRQILRRDISGDIFTRKTGGIEFGDFGIVMLTGRDQIGEILVHQPIGSDQPRYFGMHDPAIAPVACGGNASLKALLVQGRVVVENGAIPGLDMQALRRDAEAFVNRVKKCL